MLQRVILRFSVENFLSHKNFVPKNFVEKPFCVSENFWFRKMLGIREGAGITIFRQKVLSHSTESFRRGTLLCFRKFWVSKNFMPKRGISRFSVENLLSHSTEIFRRGTLLCCFRKFPAAKKLMDKKGVYQDFPSKICCLTVSKFFVGESFNVLLISGIEKC